jgi:WD40 repeat protein
MSPPASKSLRELFLEAVEIEDAGARAAFLAKACGDDANLRQRLEALLAADQGAGQAPSAPPGPRLVEEAGSVIGRYKLLEKIGEGGCGAVYMAQQEEPVRRQVALKIIKLGMDTRSVIARFEAERQALALMDHPNIAKVHDAGATETGRPYFVMELVRGIKITNYCDQNNLSTRQRLDLFAQVCGAVQHAHQKGIIHRDLKPSNILVTQRDGVPVPKVIDFGIAKATTDQRLTDKTVFTAFEQFLGTPAYVSPEQAETSELGTDTRSDIYSLGVLLYELLTGSTPFDTQELLKSGLEAMRRTIREQEPPTPSARLTELQSLAAGGAPEQSKIKNQKSKIPADLDWIVMKCLEKDRARRYETANGLAMDIQRHLSNEPVVARPPGRAYQFQKLVRRNKLVFGAAAVVTAVLVLGVVASTWEAVRATRAEGRAMTAQKNESRERAQAEQRLYDSLLGEARARRAARRVGYRDKVFQLLRQAKALNLPQKDLSELRHEAVACMGDFVGLTPVTFTDFPSKTAIYRACLDPTGQLAAFALSDGKILLRELPSGKEVAELKTQLPAFSVCFNAQGDQLVSVNYLPRPQPIEVRVQPARVYVWGRKADGQWNNVDEVALPGAWECLPCGNGIGITIFSYHPRQGKLFDLQTKTVIQVFDFPAWEAEWGIPCATVSPDGRFLASENQSTPGLRDHEIDLLDLKTGGRLARLEPRFGDFSSLTFSPDGTELCCLSDWEGGAIYRMDDFRRITEFSGSFRYMSRPSFSLGAKVVALPIGLQQSGTRVWSALQREDIAMLDEPEPAFEALFANDESSLMTYGVAFARFYRLNMTPEKLGLPGHAGVVSAMAFGPDGQRLASVGTDRKLRLWDCQSGQQAWESANLPGSGQSVAYSPDGKLLAAGDADTRWISLLDARSGKLLGGLGTHSVGWNWSTQFSPDGRFLVTAGGGYEYEQGVEVWALEREELPTPTRDFQASLFTRVTSNSWSLVFAPDSRHVAFVDNPGENTLARLGGYRLYVWDLSSSAAPRVVATNFIATTQSACFSPDSSKLLYATADRTVTTIDLDTGREVSRFPTLDLKRIRGRTDFPRLALSPDGSTLAMASTSSLGVDLWDPGSGSLRFSLPEENGAVSWLAWSPDSRRLAVARSGGAIAIWNLTKVEENLSSLGLDPQL